MTSLSQAAEIAATKHPRLSDKVIQYGTAGFRTKAAELDSVMYRMGLLAVLRSKVKQGQTIGVMITASHNPEEDNGVKLVDPMGEMLELAWEKHASQLANVSDSELRSFLEDFVKQNGIDMTAPSNIVLGRDTRRSSPALARAVQDGLYVLDSESLDYGILSTPQLHYMVRCINSKGSYGQPDEKGYFEKLSSAFMSLMKSGPTHGNYVPRLNVDGANGVGAIKMEMMKHVIQNALNVTVVNDGAHGKLNHNCGADFVKVQQTPPEGLALQIGERCASFDGDADRIVYYYLNNKKRFCLLDGDKIATLVAAYLKELVSSSGLNLKMGLVQTAYANGSSTKYISDKLKIPVACVPTGVKHLHHKATEYDVGVYFEANGHGTVLFSDNALSKIDEAAEKSNCERERTELRRLQSVINVINQTVGDAISDMLLVELVLCSKGWSAEDWNAAYTDLPNRQLKVKVKDRTVIQTTDAERRTTMPDGLQAAIDSAVAPYPEGRSFVRPSGTEDVVRVYAEADSRENADRLANEISLIVYDMAGGVGDRPKSL